MPVCALATPGLLEVLSLDLLLHAPAAPVELDVVVEGCGPQREMLPTAAPVLGLPPEDVAQYCMRHLALSAALRSPGLHEDPPFESPATFAVAGN